MPHEVTLPSGGVVVLRDVDELEEGDRRAITETVARADNRRIALYEAVRTMVAQVVQRWTIPYLQGDATPLPRADPAVLDRLRLGDYTMLEEETDSYHRVMFPPAETPDDAGTPGSPTGPADA